MSSVYPSRAAERVLWRERFESPAKVHANGGTLYGGAVPNRGLPLDRASSQYAIFSIGATDLTRPEINGEIVFSPNFAPDGGGANSYFFYDTYSGGGNRYAMYRQGSGGAYVMSFFVGGAVVGVVALATYAPYWLEGEKNRVLFSSVSGATLIWLNGHLISSDATAWSPLYPTAIAIGSGWNGTENLDGTLYDVTFRAGLLTQADVDAIESGDLFNYMNRANLVLDMKEQTERAGTVLGRTDLMVDGDMEAVGTAAYTATNSAALTKVSVDPASGLQNLNIAYGGVANPGATEDILISGRRYRARGKFRASAWPAAAFVKIGTTTKFTQANVWTYFDFVAVANSATFTLYGQIGAGEEAEFDDVEVFETDEFLRDPDMEETGVESWLDVGAVTKTKETGTPYQGLQVLRLAAAGAGDVGVYQVAATTGLVAGYKYQVIGRARGDGTNIPRVDDTAGTIWTGVAGTDWQEIKLDFIMGAGAGFYLMNAAAAAGYVEFDSMSVRLVLAQTLDKSRFGHVCTLGNGYGGWPPEFIDPGYRFVNDYIWIPHADTIFGHAEQTVAMAFKPYFAPTYDAGIWLMDSESGGLVRYGIHHDDVAGGSDLEIYMGDLNLIVPLASYAPYWVTNGLNVLIISVVTGNSYVMLNGHVVLSSAGAYTPYQQIHAELGTYKGRNGYWFLGELHKFRVWSERLCQLAARDLTLELGVVP
ncbi:MAG: hypothetical protein ABIK89_06165 [Planctomycetota bacterium]